LLYVAITRAESHVIFAIPQPSQLIIRGINKVDSLLLTFSRAGADRQSPTKTEAF
jgi:ATP-dependent exoDNAse (exonuclease V) beta subunit